MLRHAPVGQQVLFGYFQTLDSPLNPVGLAGHLDVTREVQRTGVALTDNLTL